MKNLFLLISLMFVSTLLFSSIQIAGDHNEIFLSYQAGDDPLAEGKISRTLAIAATEVELIISHCEIESFSPQGELLETKRVSGEDFARISSSFVMRELYGHNVEIELSSSSGSTIDKLKKIDLEVRGTKPVAIPNRVSRAFLPIYKNSIDNFEISYLRNLEVQESKMLIITHQQLLPTVQFFTEWKNARGIATEIVLKSDIGTTSAEIKDHISYLYHTEEFPPDFVVLTGDVNGQFAIPSFYISSGTENNVTDHTYALLEGDDYFPELLIGRMSIDTVNELQTIVSKVFSYEKQPYMGNTDWFEKALLVAGNYSSSLPHPTTPVKVTQWLKDKMVDYGYQNITELYYWPPHYNVYPGTAQINAALNSGVSIVSYRGWGDANGWHYPRYHVSDMVGGLANGLYLPVVTSIVCNTGDFANTVDPCFGEQWLTMGSPTNPAGGVAFVGPSDLHTNTKFNNSIFSGLYAGLLDEAIHCFGASVLRGKMELHDNYPLNREPGDKVEFYFHVYNILGDPSINVWTKVPQLIDFDLPAEISLGTNYLEITAPGMDEAVVTAIKDNEVFIVEEIIDNTALLYFNLQTPGEMTITMTKPNFYPSIQTIDVISQNIDIGLEQFTSAGPVIAGQAVQISLQLRNFGSQTAMNVNAELTTDSPYVNMLSGSADYGTMFAGESVTRDFQIELEAACPDHTVLYFDLDISSGSTAKFELVANSLAFEVMDVIVQDDNGVLEPDETSEISLVLKNMGSFDAANLDLQLVGITDDLTIVSNAASLPILLMGETAEVNFTVHLSQDCFVGKNLQFRLDITNADALFSSAYFNLEAGIITNTAPTGPDGYGYYAYDGYDRIYTEAPIYNWIEIDPLEGGSGNVLEMGDDVSVTIEMPFDFPYYGVVTDSITICSNGWISMQPTWETYFRNWNIPSALGPYGCISPFWDDLIGEEISPENHAKMRICYYHDTDQDIFIVEWNKCVNRFDNQTVEKLQLILYDPLTYPTLTGDGEIQFNYQEVHNIDADNNYATVGIENFQQNDGILITYANQYPASASELENGLAIKFTTDPPQYIPLVIPSADFSAEITNGMYPLEVQFINQTDLMFPVNTYLWDFGDGSSSSELDPVHLYESSGEYDVSLTVTNSQGSDTIIKQSYITVVDPELPLADFEVDSYGGIKPVTVQFQNISTPNHIANSYLWDFGDGSTSDQISPVHTYSAAGNYDVMLIAANPIGSDTLLVENLIMVLEDNVVIWPGDTDNNGIVNNLDILPIGVYWREQGDQRSEITNNWSGSSYPANWEIDLAAFADCNGDGEVDIADVLAICLNWNKMHESGLNSPSLPADLEIYRDNFEQIYQGLGQSGKELELKNFLAEKFGFPLIEPARQNQLAQNYPNPFNPVTTISYDLAQNGLIELKIYNLKGQLVKTLVNEKQSAGSHSVVWNSKDQLERQVSSGLYFYKLIVDKKTVETRKMLLLK